MTMTASGARCRQRFASGYQDAARVVTVVSLSHGGAGFKAHIIQTGTTSYRLHATRTQKGGEPAGRSYGEKRVEDDLHQLGVHRGHPTQGQPGKARQATNTDPRSEASVKWRTGSEGRISRLKRGYGWDRTRLDGIHGARTWTGLAVLAHNLVKIAALTG
jgi:Transposase DDE domain